jgi:TolA-binding protein
LLISQHDKSQFLPDAYLKLGLNSYVQKDLDVALRYFKTVVERFPKTSAANEALTFIEIIYDIKNDREGYLKWLKKSDIDIDVSYQDSSFYTGAMKRYLDGDCIGATKTFNSYIKQFGDDGHFIIPVNYYKAECDYYNDRVNQALNHYKYVVNSGRNEFTEKALLKLCKTYYKQKDYSEALAYYDKLERMTESQANFISAIVGAMRCHDELGNDEKARNKALELLPLSNVPKDELVEANLILGRYQFNKNAFLTAKSHFDYVIAESKNEATAEALYSRAYIYFDQGKLEKSRDDIYKVNEDFSSYEFWVVKGFILLSDIYVKEEDYFQAKATLQSILDNYDNESDGLRDICRSKIKQIEALENPVDSNELEEE